MHRRLSPCRLHPGPVANMDTRFGTKCVTFDTFGAVS